MLSEDGTEGLELARALREKEIPGGGGYKEDLKPEAIPFLLCP